MGANGFLGSHLVDDLISSGYSVRAFDLFRKGESINFNYPDSRLEIYRGDFLNPESVDKALEGIEFVFHFIYLGNPVSSFQNPVLDIERNIFTSLGLFEACIRRGVKKIIYPSSGGTIYGDIGNGLAQEETLPRPSTPYAINKFAIEKYLDYYQRYRGLDYIVYRISNPYGERQIVNGSQGIVAALMSRGILKEAVDIYGNSVRDYIYVKDVTTFIAKNFYKDHRRHVYNLGSGQGLALSEVVSMVEEVTGLALKINYLERREFDIERIVLDVGALREEFQFSPSISFVDGIKRTYDFLRGY